MEAQLEEIREQQKATWNKFSPGWRKWDEFTMNFLKPMGDEIIRQLKLKDTDVVLDVAAGTGEPGLTIAEIVKTGRVVITDLADGMLDVARDHAAIKGIRNVEFKAADVSELPFPDNTFDAISCRMGYMFFPDMAMAAKEMLRVLKPGGRMATSVWGTPDKNFWASATMGTINQMMQLQPPPAGAVGLFRCCGPGAMKEVLEKAGFRNVKESEVAGSADFGNMENYWSFQNEVAAPVVAAMSKADADMREKVRQAVSEKVASKNSDGGAALEYSSLVVYGEKA